MDTKIIFPEEYTRRELNKMYREIPLKNTTSLTLRKYFNAMANLYGICTLRKAYEIISSQSPNLVSMEEFLAFSEIARHEIEAYYILGEDEIYTDGELKDVLDRQIIDVMLFDEDIDDYEKLAYYQRGKQYYIPKKTTFLKYDDPDYYEPSREADAIKNFFTVNLNLKEDLADRIFSVLLSQIRYEQSNISGAFKVLDGFKIIFNNDKEVETFVNLYNDLSNNTRIQWNRGFTPNEMFSMMPPEKRMPKSVTLGPNIKKSLSDGTMDVDEMRNGILSADFLSEELRLSMLKELDKAENKTSPVKKPPKVGRNDPCPCGSGKKYKKCCGR